MAAAKCRCGSAATARRRSPFDLTRVEARDRFRGAFQSSPRNANRRHAIVEAAIARPRSQFEIQDVIARCQRSTAEIPIAVQRHLPPREHAHRRDAIVPTRGRPILIGDDAGALDVLEVPNVLIDLLRSPDEIRVDVDDDAFVGRRWTNGLPPLAGGEQERDGSKGETACGRPTVPSRQAGHTSLHDAAENEHVFSVITSDRNPAPSSESRV